MEHTTLIELTVNHFACFDYMLKFAHEDLTEEMIKKFHSLLKRNTSDEKKRVVRCRGLQSQA